MSASKQRAKPAAQAPHHDAFYLACIFITGAATLSMELLASRIMTPYFGVSLFIWSGILSITLIALALGYYVGGRATRQSREGRHRSLDALFLLMPAVSGIILVGACLLYPKIFHALGSASLVFGSFAACMLLIFVPLVAVSAMNPLLIAIHSERNTNPSAPGDSGSGLVFFISTVGSVVGVSLTAFGFIPNATNFRSMLVVSGILSATSLVGALRSENLREHEKSRLLITAGVGIVLAAGLFVAAPSYLKKDEPIVFDNASWTLEREYTSMFGNTKILSVAPIPGTPDAELQDLYATYYYNDGMTQNIVDDNGDSMTPFTYVLQYLATGLRPEAKRVLVLGLGAGIVPMKLAEQGIDVDVVEIDPSSITAAEDYFGFDRSAVRTVQTDARTFVRGCQGDYDVALMDVAHGDGFPDYLLTVEFFADLERCLSRDGIAVLNTYAHPERLDPYYSIVKSLNTAFPEIRMYHDGIEARKPAVSVYLAAFRRPDDTRLAVTRDVVPSALAPLLGEVFSQEREIDRERLARARVLEDDFNTFSFINLESDEHFRHLVLSRLPPEFLVN